MEDLIELAFLCFVIYLLYKLVFGLILPVSKAASQVKNKINEFNRVQQDQIRQQRQATPPPSTKGTQKKSRKEDDYIDFEEVPPRP